MGNVYLAHYGIKNQKWGFRRFQNEDGTLTPAGRERYGIGPARADRKVNKAELAVYETGYQVKKIGGSLRNDAKQIAKNVREAARDRYTEPSRTLRKESAARARERQKQERIAAKSKKLEEEKARLTQKLVDKQNRKTIAELKKMLDDASLNGARREVERLAAKRDRAKEKAAYKEAAKQLRKEVKTAKKDAEKEAKRRYSRDKIKDLSDEELDARIKRLQNEIKLRGLEAERSAPTVTAGVKYATDIVGSGVSTAAKQLIGASATSLGKQVLGLTDEEINEFIRLTKKK